MDESTKKDRVEPEEKDKIEELERHLKTRKRELKKEIRKKMNIQFMSILLFLDVIIVSGFAVQAMKQKFYEKKEEQYKKWEQSYKKQIEQTAMKANSLWKQIEAKIEEKEKIVNVPQVTSMILKDDNKNELNQYVSSLKHYPDQNIELQEIDGMSYYEITKQYEIDEYTICDPRTDIIFPGSIIKGDSLFKGTENYVPVTVGRTPMYLTCTNDTGHSQEVDNISYRTISDVLHYFQDKGEEAHAQAWNYYLKTINSSEELKFSLGINALSVGLDLGNQISKSNSTVAIVYKQIYYSVNAEPLRDSVDYFKDGSDLSDIGMYEPAYVSSVDYGRMVVVFVSGNMESSELAAKLNSCLGGVKIGVGLSKIAQDEELEIHICQFGGESKDINTILGTTSHKKGVVERVDEFWNGSDEQENIASRINDFLDMGGKLINPVPLSYRLKYLSDNSPVPAKIIEKKKYISDRTAKMIKIKLRGTIEGILQLDVPDTMGVLMTEDWTSISKEGDTTGEVAILWDSLNIDSIKGKFNNKDIILDLSHDILEEQNSELIEVASENKVYADIHIGELEREMP